jgi:hypothetical protein
MMTTIVPTTNTGIEAERVFDFLLTNPRSAKPRHEGLTARPSSASCSRRPTRTCSHGT